jgi:hypothetical protein
MMTTTDEYWMALVGHRVVFKVTLHVAPAYDYYNGYIVALHDAGDATIALIEINGDRFWTEVDRRTLYGRSLTTSARRYEVVVDEGVCDDCAPTMMRGG